MNTVLPAFDLIAALLFSVCDEMAARAKARVRSALSMMWVSTVALVLMTLWVLIQGYRMISGQSREPMMGVVVNMTRSAVIVAAATTMAVGSVDLQQFFTHDLAKGINQLVTGKDESPVKAIEVATLGLLTEASHPGNLLYEQAKSALQRIDVQFDRKPDQLTDDAAAAIAVAAQKAGLTRINHLELGGADNSNIFAVQGNLGTAHSKVIDVSTLDAMQTPMVQSAKAFEEAQHVHQHARAQQPQQVVRR